MKILALHEFQKHALAALSRPAHVLCIAPTGSGKSLIYETLAKDKGLRVLLVTPLVALARQQALSLSQKGVKISLGAGNPLSEDPSAVPGPETGVWIVSPELIACPPRARIMEHWRPDLLVVDECHCLWEWGKDFRPAFEPIPELIDHYGIKRSLWLTATLPYAARVELRTRLPKPLFELGGFELPEALHLNTLQVPWINRADAMRALVRENTQAGVIFVQTRIDAVRVAALVAQAGRKSIFYHAGISREERRALEKRALSGNTDVIVATSAFGMGMHFPHLGWTALWQAPLSLLALAQAVGRVARGTTTGRGLVFWDEEDFRLLEAMAQGSDRKKNDMLDVLSFLKTQECRRQSLIRYFDRREVEACETACDFCTSRQNKPQ